MSPALYSLTAQIRGLKHQSFEIYPQMPIPVYLGYKYVHYWPSARINNDIVRVTSKLVPGAHNYGWIDSWYQCEALTLLWWNFQSLIAIDNLNIHRCFYLYIYMLKSQTLWHSTSNKHNNEWCLRSQFCTVRL